MTCPYLDEKTIVFCGASPFKKPIPVERLSPESRCLGDAYLECPIYRELIAKEGRDAAEALRSREAGESS